MLDITEQTFDDVTVLHLRGRLVLEDGEVALGNHIDRLLQQERLRLVLDLREVTYIDSAGLGLLVSRYVRARRRGGDVRFVHLTERSTRLMNITKLSDVFATYPTQEDAVRSFHTA